MEITLENLHRAIAALRQCANENAGKPTDTGNVVVAGLCTDVADFLEKEFDTRHRRWLTDVKVESIYNRCRIDKREFTTAEERSHVSQSRMFEGLIDTRLIETREAADPTDESGNMIVVHSEMLVGVKKGIDLDKELAHEDYELGCVGLKTEPKFGHFETDPVTGKTEFVRPKRKDSAE